MRTNACRALALCLVAGTVRAQQPWFPGAPGIGQAPVVRCLSTEFAGTTTTTGEVDGQRLRAEESTFGGTTTTGAIGDRSFRCESFEFGGVVTRTCR